jgi:hypothetical protein
LPRNRDFIYSFFPSKLEPQASALGFNYANQVLLGVDYPIVSFEDYVPDFDGLVVKKALGGDAVDPKPAANTEGEGAVAYVDETGNDQRQTQEACEAKASDFIADKIESQEERRALKTFYADQ